MQSSNPLPKLIGLTGRAGAGKDTLADYLVSVHGYVKYSLASPLKNALNAAFGFTPEDWNDRAWKERVIPWLGKSPRQLAQTLGTEWGRECVASDVWLRCADQFLLQNIEAPGVVIPDIRFVNEAQFVRERSGFICEIARPGLTAVSAHASENGLPLALVNGWLTNNSCTDTLAARAEVVLRKYPRSISAHTPPFDDHFA